ncbi:hypothetical protein HS088_TW04G01559 [Tripterygium wilfordii]|uniref:RING-type domain-containing protein n=1 Tax=Tripterygium wilfordii TaxID=458696 RepID=A0A7J7DTH9_TRIWF|nr:uncharacterized protein LOC119996191 [Tripterygium wilfordii]KAF5749589.1 hypothetical protein HS088_TW04G01559 [Tripterygium wilfordii]
MGKRKRSNDRTNHNLTFREPPSASDNMPCSSGTHFLYKEKPAHLVQSSGLMLPSRGSDIADASAKPLNIHSSVSNHHHNLGRSIFLKRSRHHYGHQYSRRNTSTSHVKVSPFRDERLSFKFINQCNPESSCHTDKRDKAFSSQERIRSSSLVMDSISSDIVKMVCGICQKLLRRKPYFLGDGMSSGENSVVAVLICGHVFHADCLEARTGLEDRRDPACPLCLGLELTEVDAPSGQELPV